MLNSICIEEVQNRGDWYFENYYCFNLSRFGELYGNSVNMPSGTGPTNGILIKFKIP